MSSSSLGDAEVAHVSSAAEPFTHERPIPDDVVLVITSFLTPSDLLTAQCVAHAWREGA